MYTTNYLKKLHERTIKQNIYKNLMKVVLNIKQT